MREFFHYTLEKNVSSIVASGVYSGDSCFTTTEYFNASQAGSELGVMAHNIDCVLKFKDDGLFKKCQDVPKTGRFAGGGNQYMHSNRPKPIAVRKITDRVWNILLKPEKTRWQEKTKEERVFYVMNVLIKNYGCSVNGTAGLVGNLYAESGLIPNRIEGSTETSPMASMTLESSIEKGIYKNRRSLYEETFAKYQCKTKINKVNSICLGLEKPVLNRKYSIPTLFSAEQIMNRNKHNLSDPNLPGVGLAQWTLSKRRKKLFAHKFHDNILGKDILFDIDAQIDYLIWEIKSDFEKIYKNVLQNNVVSLQVACDNILEKFENPKIKNYDERRKLTTLCYNIYQERSQKWEG